MAKKKAMGKTKGKGGKLKIILAIAFLVCLLGGCTALLFGPMVKRKAMAKGVEIAAERAAEEFKMTDAAREECLGPLLSFTSRVSSGEFTSKQTEAILREIGRNGAAAIFAMHGFESKYLGNMSEEERIDARITLSRFVHGLNTGRIRHKKVQSLEKILVVPGQTSFGIGKYSLPKLRDSLSNTELEECLAILQDAADEAGIPDQEYEFRFEEKLQQAIAKGKK